jgi:hypothetical protein
LQLIRAALIVLNGKNCVPVAVESEPEFATYKTFLVPSAFDHTGSKPSVVKTEPTTPIGNLVGV